MKRWTMWVGAVLVAMGLAACSSDDESKAGPTGFTQPAGTVAVNFSVTDNSGSFRAGELEWKGAMKYDAATRIVTKDAGWGGPYAPLYDDGPWNVATIAGHEPAGSRAGDHVWGVTIFVAPPAAGTETYGYGLQDAAYQTSFGNGWIWPAGPDGSFSVDAGRTAPINATGTTIPAWGTTDWELTVNANDMATALTTTSGPPTITSVGVKSSAWAWGVIPLADDGLKGDAAAGDHVYTLRLSEYAGTGKLYFHTGLLHSGATPQDKPEFVFVWNGTTKEYKDANGVARTAGVASRIKPAATWDPVTVVTSACGNTSNTCVVVP